MKVSFGVFFFAVGLAVCATAGTAQAQASRTWVSGVGDDANPCSRTAPCKTFAGAISKTQAGGEIDALDPGGFGTLTITKAITIDGGGGQVASVLASGTPGFTVAAGNNDVVILRNLRINGIVGTGSGGTIGVNFVSGEGLFIENCNIFDFTQYGIQFKPPTASTLVITNSTVDVNTLGALTASTTAASGSVHITAIGTTFTGASGGPGVTVGQNTSFQMSGGAIASNALYGLLATGTNANAILDSVAVSNNYSGGLHATSSGLIAITNDAVTFNAGTGLVFDGGGQIVSWGNNHVYLNKTGSVETDGAPSSTKTPI